MKATELFFPTLRDMPADADTISQKLLLKAGFVRKTASGVYTVLPLGTRVMHKIMNVVREEMDRFGGQEVLLPILQPAELWQQSGRWDVYGEEMFRLRDRHQREFCLGPTHEEIITALIKNEINSYKQLPLLLYQIQNKYRDERRPRFGLMRAREFVMKDLYSFDRDWQGLAESYQKMYQAYQNIFYRLGLNFRVVEADSGAIGGSESHEFVVLAETGEAVVVYCEDCDYAANIEKAEAVPQLWQTEKQLPMTKVATPDVTTIEQVVDYLDVDVKRTLKTLFYDADGRVVALLVRGDRQANEIKLQNYLGALELNMASAEQVSQLGTVFGSAGPVGLQGVPVFADLEVREILNVVVGANEEGFHLTNVNPGRDFDVDQYEDFRLAESGDKCPKCGHALESVRGIEVGHIFKLGIKYSSALGTNYTDENGNEHPIVMGSYGIGIGRTMAAAVEQNHDEKGIKWPMAICPFAVIVIPANSQQPEQAELGKKLHAALQAEGIEAVLDDRQERAGVKFNDADLVGYPWRVTVGKKTVDNGTVDLKSRTSGEERTMPLTEVLTLLSSLIKKGKNEFDNQ